MNTLPVVSWPEDAYERVKHISRIYIGFLKEVGNLNMLRLNFGTRQIDNAIKIGSNLTVLDYFHQYEAVEEESSAGPAITLKPPEEAVQLAMNYLIDELIVRQPRPNMMLIETLNEAMDFGGLFKKLRELDLRRWGELFN